MRKKARPKLIRKQTRLQTDSREKIILSERANYNAINGEQQASLDKLN